MAQTWQSQDMVTNNQNVFYYVKVTLNSQSVANCTSSITCDFYAYRKNAYDTYADGSWIKGSIDGTAYTGNFNASKKINTTPVLLYSKTQTISHDNSTGVKSFVVTAQLFVNNDMPDITSNAQSFQVTLPTIARASTISSVSPSSVTVNGSNKVTVNISRKNSSFTHTVTYKIGSTTKATQTGVGTSTSYTIPWSWLGSTSLENKTVTVYVQTKNGSSNVGSAVSATFSITLPSASTISSSTASVITANDSNRFSISLSRSVSSLTHTITYKINGTTVATQTGVGASTTYTIPTSWLKVSNTIATRTVDVSVQTRIVASGVDANIGTPATTSFDIKPPSASTIASLTSSVAVNGTNKVTLYLTRESTKITHTVTYKKGATTITTQSDIGASTTYTPPASWLSNASYLKNAVSCTITVSVQTYIAGVLYGSPVTKTFAATVPASYIPTLGSVTTGDYTLDKGGNQLNWGVYVQGKSKVDLTFNNAAGSNGSTVSSYSYSGGGKSATEASSTYRTAVINSSGDTAFSFYVTDSRGRASTAKSKTLHFEPYALPKISGLEAFRSNSVGVEDDNGSYITLHANLSCSSCDGNNTLTAKVYYQTSGDGDSWSEIGSYTSGDWSTYGGLLSPDVTYNVKLDVQDAFSEVYQVNEIRTSFSTVDYLKGGHGVAFGKAAEEDDEVEVSADWTLHAHGDTQVDGDLTVAGEAWIGDTLGVYGGAGVGGNLGVNGYIATDGHIYQNHGSTNSRIYWRDNTEKSVGRITVDGSTRRVYLTEYRTQATPDSDSYLENYRLPAPDIGTSSTVNYEILTSKTVHLYSKILGSATSVPTGITASNVLKIENLPSGTYVIVAQLAFDTSSAGTMRCLYIGTTATGYEIARVEVGAPSSSIPIYLSASNIVTASGTIYLNGIQNSGADLNARATGTFLKAIRIL